MSATETPDPWYSEKPDSWYDEQRRETASMLEEALSRNPSRIIFEYDGQNPDQKVGLGWPELDREVSYQVKYFYDHGYWSATQISGGPPINDMARVMQLAVLVATNPELPLAQDTRDRLERKGLLY